MSEHRDPLLEARHKLAGANFLGLPVRAMDQVDRGTGSVIRLAVSAPFEPEDRDRIADAMHPLSFELQEVVEDADGRRPGVDYRT